MFSSDSIDACLRHSPLVIPREEGCTYYAAMDPATRGNGWTLAVATRKEGRIVVVAAHEWIGSRDEPLDPEAVLGEVSDIVVPYRITTVHSDQVMGDALVKLARQKGISLAQWTYNGTERTKKYLHIRTLLDRRLMSIPAVPHLRTDLLHIRKRTTPGGMMPVLPMTTDGRHCDWGPTLMLALSKLLPDPTPPKKAEVDPETERMREEFLKRCGAKKEW